MQSRFTFPEPLGHKHKGRSMNSPENATYLQSIVEAHPSVNRAWTSDSVRAQLKGFTGSGLYPYLECEEVNTPRALAWASAVAPGRAPGLVLRTSR